MQCDVQHVPQPPTSRALLNMQQHMHVSYHARIGVILKGQNAGKGKGGR
jgi:hypothetical protein